MIAPTADTLEVFGPAPELLWVGIPAVAGGGHGGAAIGSAVRFGSNSIDLLWNARLRAYCNNVG
jgi:hypothetical protein